MRLSKDGQSMTVALLWSAVDWVGIGSWSLCPLTWYSLSGKSASIQAGIVKLLSSTFDRYIVFSNSIPIHG